MSIVQTRPLKVIEYSSGPEPQLSAEYAHILRITFGTNQQVYIPSQQGLNFPAGADVSEARIAVNGISAITDNAGVQSNIATITGCTVTLTDVNFSLAQKFANKLASGVGSRHKLVEIFSQHPAGDFDEDNLLYTFILENYDNSPKGKEKILTLKDIARETSKDIFEPKEWTLVQSVGENDTEIHISSGDDEDFRFARGSDDNRYPGETIGYMAFGSGLDREIWSYSAREKMGEDWYKYTVKDRALFDTTRRSFDIDPDEPVENNEAVKEFVYYREDARDALLMATVGRTRDGRIAPEHWSPEVPETGVDLNSIGASRFDDVVEIEEPPEQEAKTFYEKYLLTAMGGSVMRVSRQGKLQLQPVDPAPPDADAKVVFDNTNIDMTSLSPLKVKQDGLANPLVAYWDYNPLIEDFQNKVIQRDLIAEGIHGASEKLDIEFPAFHTGSHTGSQVNQRMLAFSERYSYPTTTISFDAVASMRWVPSGTIVRLTTPLGVVIDDSNGEFVDVDRTFLIIGRRYNPSTRKVRYFLWGTSGKSIEQSDSTLSSHIPDSEFFRDATNIATVLPITNGVLSGTGHTIAPGNYYYDGDLVLAPGLKVAFSRRGPKFALRVTGTLTHQADDPWLAKGNGPHAGGVGATGSQLIGTPGEAGYFGRSTGGGGFDLTVQYRRGPQVTENIPLYSIAGWQVTNTQGVTNPPPMTESIPVFPLSLNDGQFSGIPADLSGSGGAGGSSIYERDSGLDGLAAQQNNLINPTINVTPVPTAQTVVDGRDGAYGGMGIEYWSRGGGWDGDGSVNTSGADAGVGGNYYIGIAPGAPGPSMPGVFVWVMDDPSAILPDTGPARVTANTGAVNLEGVRAGIEPFYRPAGQLTPALYSYHAPTTQQNLASTAARAMYSPKPATVSRRYTGVDLAFVNQRDNKIALIPNSGADPSDGNPGDLTVLVTELADSSNLAPASAKVMDNNYKWVEFDWENDSRRTAYLNLLQSNRVHGGVEYFNQEDRPTTFKDNSLWRQPSTKVTWRLQRFGPPDVLVFVDDTEISDNRFKDPEFTDLILGGSDWVIRDDISTLPQFALDQNSVAIGPTIVAVEFGGDAREVEAEEYPLASINGVSVVVNGSTGATVSFNEPSDTSNITGYEIRRNGTLITTLSVGTDAYNDTGLTGSTSYTYVVRAVNATERGPDSAGFTITTDPESSGSNNLNPVTGLNGSVYSRTALELFWSPPQSPGVGDGYEIYRDSVLVASKPGITTNSHFESELIPGTTYAYAVRVVGGGERSDDAKLRLTTNA